MPRTLGRVIPISSALLVLSTLVVEAAETRAETCPEVVGPTQEQSGNLSTGASLNGDVAQTFTVIRPGRIEAVEIVGGDGGGFRLPHHQVFADLRGVVNGIPAASNSAALAAITIPQSELLAVEDWFRIEFGEHGPLVQPGQTLALVLRVNGNFGVSWRGHYEPVPGDAYPGGRMYVRNPSGAWETPDDENDVHFGYRHFDLTFRVFTCEQPVPVVSTTWGRLKARYD